MEEQKRHVWQMIRCGGSDQVYLQSGEDLLHLRELDQKLWAAMSCPVAGIRMDRRTLDLLDTDHDQRIRIPELLSAVDWLAKRLKNLDGVFAGTDRLPLSSIREDTEEGRAIRQTALRVLGDLGKADASALTLADVQDTERIFSNTLLNGDGIFPPDQVKDEACSKLLAEIAGCLGTVSDRSGVAGVGEAQIKQFFDAVRARLAWRDSAADTQKIFPLGDQTASAAAALSAVVTKIDDYFTRCAMVAYDARSAAPLSRSDSDYAAFAAELLSDQSAKLADFPIAKISATDLLPLTEGINPFWQKSMTQANALLFTPLGIHETLSAEKWNEVKRTFAPYLDWLSKEAGKEVAALSDAHLRQLAEDGSEQKLMDLLAQDLALAPTYARITDLVQLILYHAHLIELLRNMVNMSRLYDPSLTPLFCVGTLYIDGRQCSLCFQIDQPAKHSVGAEKSKCSLVYCEVIRPGAGEKMNICVPVTAGTSRTLSVGLHGVFFDVEGKDWDATVVKVIEHPIDLREAFWAPWRKIAEMLSAQIAKFLSAKQNAMVTSVVSKTSTLAAPKVPAAKPVSPPTKVDGTALASSVAAIGIAVGLVGSAIGGLVSTLTALPLWKTLLGVLCVFLLVSLPSVVLTWFKLRSRDLSAILNASGWALNIRLGFSLKLGRLFTTCAAIPKGAKRRLRDPYADRRKWPYVLAGILLVGAAAAAIWYFFFRSFSRF